MRLLLVISMLLLTFGAATAGSPPAAYVAMIAKLHSLKTYQTTIDASIAMRIGSGSSDQSGKMTMSERVVYKGPNLLVVSIPDTMGGITIWSDGEHLYQYYGMSNKYKESAVPADLISAVTAGAGRTGLVSAGTGSLGGERVSIVKGPGMLQGSQMTMWIGEDDHLPRQITTVQPKTSATTYTTVLTQVFHKTVVNQPIAITVFHLSLPQTAFKASDQDAVPGGIGLDILGAAK